MTQTKTEMYCRKIAGYFIHLGLITGLATLTFGLASCGGGGGGGDGAPAPIDTSMTITSITPPGIVASSVVQTLIIAGSNFPSGASISITNASGVPVASAVSVTSTVITAEVKIDTAPTDRYVMVSVQAPSSGTAVDYVLGVAALRKNFTADILPILQIPATAASCTGCHTGTTNGGLDLNTANHLNSEPSQGCSSRFRVKRGDPRRSSSFLIDKIQAHVGSPACYGSPMPASGALNPSEIQEIVDWVAGGAL